MRARLIVGQYPDGARQRFRRYGRAFWLERWSTSKRISRLNNWTARMIRARLVAMGARIVTDDGASTQPPQSEQLDDGNGTRAGAEWNKP